MGYLFDVLDFPDQSRMTDVWDNRWIDEPLGDEIAAGHLIRLGDEQHVAVESDFLCSHMAFSVCGLGGLFADGTPWVFLMQKAPADLSARLLGDADPHRVLGDGVNRAVAFNPEAVVVREVLWSRQDLVDAYEGEGIPADTVGRWPVADLLRGFLAECSKVSLPDIVAGYPDCAYRDSAHACEADVFRDVFATWGKDLK